MEWQSTHNSVFYFEIENKKTTKKVKKGDRQRCDPKKGKKELHARLQITEEFRRNSALLRNIYKFWLERDYCGHEITAKHLLKYFVQ